MGLSATGYYRLYVGYEVGSTWYPIDPAVTTTIAVGMPGAVRAALQAAFQLALLAVVAHQTCLICLIII